MRESASSMKVMVLQARDIRRFLIAAGSTSTRSCRPVWSSCHKPNERLGRVFCSAVRRAMIRGHILAITPERPFHETEPDALEGNGQRLCAGDIRLWSGPVTPAYWTHPW